MSGDETNKYLYVVFFCMLPKKPVNRRKRQWGKTLELTEQTDAGPLAMRYFDVPAGLRNKMRDRKPDVSAKYDRKDPKGRKGNIKMLRLPDRRKPKENK